MTSSLSVSSARPVPQGIQAGADTRRAGHLPLPVILFLIALTIPISIPVGVVLTGSRIVILCTMVPLMVGLFSGRYGRILPTDWLFMIHAVWIILALLMNNPDRALQYGGVLVVDFMGAYMMGRAYIRNAADMVAMIRVLAILVALTLPLAVIEAVTGKNLILDTIRSLPLVYPNAQTAGELRMGLKRVQAGFQTPIHYGVYATLPFALCMVGLKGRISDVRRWLLSGAILLSGFLSLSSGAVLAIVMQVFLLLWQRMIPTPRRWLILLGLMVLAYVAIDVLSSRSPFRVFMSYATFSPQTAYWRDLIGTYGLQNVWQHPVFGLGLKDWERPVWMYVSSVDNFWLLAAMRFGIPGFLTVILGYALALISAIRADIPANTIVARLRLTWVFTILVLAFSLYTVHVWNEMQSAVFFVLGSGMWLLNSDFSAAQDSGATDVPDSARRRLVHSRAGLATAAAAGPERADPAPVRQSFRQGFRQSLGGPQESEARLKGGPRSPVYSRFPHRSRTPPDRER